MRITPEEYLQKPLRVHTFLAGVPLHDVWAFQLYGGGEGRTLRDFQALFSAVGLQHINPIVNGLFKLRRRLGELFGWDDERHQPPASSYVHRLTDADRARMLDEPGGLNGPFQIVYTFENETLEEVINSTVHAFSLMAMEPAANGYTVYWAIYVRKINWQTPFYMALIDPFRYIFVYPAIIKKMEQAWVSAYPEDVIKEKLMNEI
jgi:hypothetical protein